jgi:hypothetical protein
MTANMPVLTDSKTLNEVVNCLTENIPIQTHGIIHYHFLAIAKLFGLLNLFKSKCLLSIWQCLVFNLILHSSYAIASGLQRYITIIYDLSSRNIQSPPRHCSSAVRVASRRERTEG